MVLAESTLKVHYDGKGEMLKRHQMKAKSVSKSILAIETIYTEAFKEANKIYHSKVEPEVVLEGGFNEGSLWWFVKIFGKEGENQQTLNNDVSFSSISLAINKAISVLKRLSLDKSEILIKETKDGYEVEVEGEKVLLNEIESAILTNEKIRVSISDMVMPLTDEGIDDLSIENFVEPEASIKVTNIDKKNLLIRRKHKHIVDDGEMKGLFHIEDFSFNPKSKWKLISLNDPSNTFSAVIQDVEFLKKVSDNTEKFSKDDLLDIEAVWYKQKSKLTGRITTHYTIIKINDHIPVEDRQWKML